MNHMVNVKAIFFHTPIAAVAVNFKAGSSSLALAIISTYYPEIETVIRSPHGDGRGTAYPAGKGPDNTRWHSLCPQIDPYKCPVTLVPFRDPIEKFRSAMSESNLVNTDKVLEDLEKNGFCNKSHFWPQSRLLKGNVIRLYRFPCHLDALAIDAGLKLPLPNIHERDRRSPKPDLTLDQASRIAKLYAEDMSVFEAISVAGQEYKSLGCEENETLVSIPTEVTPRQIRLAFLSEGITVDKVSQELSGLSEPLRSQSLIDWEYSTVIRREDRIISTIGEVFNLTEKEIDNIFVAAGKL